MKMKKKVILMTLLLIGAVSVNAQVRIGGTAAADKAILDLNASNTADDATQGLALPRAAALPAVAPTIDGVLIYSAGDVYVSKAGVWEKLGSGTGGDSGDGGETPPPPPTFTCGTDDVTGQSGATYKTGDFGAAGCWMTENLRDSADLTNQVNVTATDYATKAFQYPNKAVANVATQGLLYTWAAATGRTGISTDEAAVNVTTDTLIQGICPTDWHIPTDAEWSELETVIALDATNNYATDGAVAWPSSRNTETGWRPSAAAASLGNKMRDVSGAGTGAYTPTSNAYDAVDGTKRGFAALLAGLVSAGTAYTFGTDANFWSASSSTADNAWRRNVSSTKGGVNRSAAAKSAGYSVRCKQN
ncbi:hypothetical protein FACS1894162_8780 [Bacteroidia bacterium]|nr:hypothetical protein FACS1894162_8780 [Bacteroidia bacterium]